MRTYNITAIAKPCLYIAVLLLFFAGAAFSEDVMEELKVEHKNIRILENEGLVPTTVIIKPGTTVIWINYSRDPMEIKFEKKQVTTACRQPINFFTGDDGAYQSKKIEMGAVASLCFIEKGEFVYQLKRREGEWADVDTKRLRGTIKVY